MSTYASDLAGVLQKTFGGPVVTEAPTKPKEIKKAAVTGWRRLVSFKSYRDNFDQIVGFAIVALLFSVFVLALANAWMLASWPG